MCMGRNFRILLVSKDELNKVVLFHISGYTVQSAYERFRQELYLLTKFLYQSKMITSVLLLKLPRISFPLLLTMSRICQEVLEQLAIREVYLH